MYWSKNTIEKATPCIVSGLTGNKCYWCVVCGQDIGNGAKVIDVDSWDDEGFRVWSIDNNDSKIQTSIPVGGYAHKKCFNIQAVKVKMTGSFHASNGRYVNKQELS